MDTQNENQVMQSVGRQFMQMAVEKEGMLQRVAQLENILNQVAADNDVLKKKLSKYEDVEGYSDGERKAVEGQETAQPKPRRLKATK